MIHYYDIRNSRYYFDDSPEKSIQEAIWVEGSKGVKEMLHIMIQTRTFLSNDKKIMKIDENRNRFFTEYIPRVMNGKVEIKTFKSINDLQIDFQENKDCD